MKAYNRINPGLVLTVYRLWSVLGVIEIGDESVYKRKKSLDSIMKEKIPICSNSVQGSVPVAVSFHVKWPAR